MFKRHLPLVAVAAALLIGAPADSAAQQQQQQTATPDREELVTFTEAFVEIAEVREEMTPAIAQAESQQEAAELQSTANERMIEILDEHELDPQRYNTITQLINNDAEVRADFEEILDEITGARL